MTSIKELFAVPPKSSKNFIAMNVRNVHKKPQTNNSAKTLSTLQSRILKETNGPNERSSSKTSCPSYGKHKPKAFRNAGCQTSDLENNESYLEDGVIRYPSSKWKERFSQDHMYKSVALQTDAKVTVDTQQINAGPSEQYNELSQLVVNADPSNTEHLLVLEGEESNNEILNLKSVDINKCATTSKNQNTISSNVKNKPELKSTKKFLENRSNIIATQPKAPAKHKRGTVPRYLIEKKIEKEREQTKMLEEAERTGVLDPDCPPGHILLPNEKRLEQLEILNKNYKNLINELNRFPVRNDSLKIRQRRVLMEKELDKLEEGIKLFSKEKLFVKP